MRETSLQIKNNTSKSSIADTAVLMINLGTPDAPNTPEVRTYLRELLSSDRVLDINPVLRWLLLNLFILPFRPQKSAIVVGIPGLAPFLPLGPCGADFVCHFGSPSSPIWAPMQAGAPQ